MNPVPPPSSPSLSLHPVTAKAPVTLNPLLPPPTKMKNTQGQDTNQGYSFGLQGKEPTMAVVERLAKELIKPDDEWQNRIQGFHSELPKDSHGAVKLTTSGTPKCFQAEITFKIDIMQDDGSPATIEFTQMIKTDVKVPLGQDNRTTKDAVIKALFILEGYRKSIKEPLIEHNDKKIHDLAQKTLFKIKLFRAESHKGFYGKKFNWEKTTAPKTFREQYASLYKHHPKGTLVGFVLEGASPKVRNTPEGGMDTIWEMKVSCEELDTQEKCLKDLQEASTHQAALGALQKSGLTKDEIKDMLHKNAAYALEQLEICLKDTPGQATSTDKGFSSLSNYISQRDIASERIKDKKERLSKIPKLPNGKLSNKNKARKAQLDHEVTQWKNRSREASKAIDAIGKELTDTFERERGFMSALELLAPGSGKDLKQQQKVHEHRYNDVKAFLAKDAAEQKKKPPLDEDLTLKAP